MLTLAMIIDRAIKTKLPEQKYITQLIFGWS